MIELIKRKHTWPHRRTANPIQPIFSSEDADLNDIKWSRCHGYASMTGKMKTDDDEVKNVTVFAHRVVLERKLGRKLQKGEVTDHLNQNKLDCRRENLAPVTKQQNSQNISVRSNSTSGFRGVVLDKKSNKWMARARHFGRWIYGGKFPTIDQANEAAIGLRKSLGFHGC